MIRIILGLGFGFLVGCSSTGFNRGALSEQLGTVKPEFNDAEIKAAYNKKANLPKPFKLGVYFKAPRDDRSYSPKEQWRWSEQDKALLAEVAEELKAEKLVSDVFPILNSVVQYEDLKSIRLAAAQHQADAVIIVTGAGQIDRYNNGLGWSYVLLLTPFFIKGSQADTLFVTNAAMWDVKNEYLYLTAEAEGMAHETYAGAFGKQDKELFDEAKTQSLKKLKEEIKKMVQGRK